MTTVYDTTLPAADASETSYKPYLEQVAPGITDIIDSTGVGGEAWYETLPRILTSVTATDEQRALLLGFADRASRGLPPVDVTPTKLTIGGVLTGISIVTLLSQIF